MATATKTTNDRSAGYVDETGLTKTERWIFEFMYATARDKGYLPTIQQIGEYFGYAHRSGPQMHVGGLVGKGWLANDRPNSANGHRLLKKPDGEPFRGFKD